MSLTVELIPDKKQGCFTACVPDVPAYGEGATEKEAIEDMKQAIRTYIEAFGMEEALSRINPPSVRQIELDLTELTSA